MATIREAFRTWLAADGTIAALVSTRIAPVRNKAREGQPSIAYQKSSESSKLHLLGTSNPTGVTFRVDCYGTSELEAAAVAQAVKDLCDGYFGMQSGVFFQCVNVTNAADNPEDPAQGDDVGVFCESVDVRVLYKG